MSSFYTFTSAVALDDTPQTTPVYKVISTGSAQATLNCKLYGSETAVDIPLATGVVFEASMSEAQITTGTNISVIAFR